ncbi:MAG: right-handed parallel beta-helix repeat-containing protein [Planctomycetes bacterium]|nr:right-handed parallel beta-helix repeat-containing protein [Planctomycetota bacterium]
MKDWRGIVPVILIVLLNTLSVFVNAETSSTPEEIARQTEKLFKHDGFNYPYEGTGKEFILSDNPIFPNLKITSSEEININIDAVTDTLSLSIVPLTTTTVSHTTINIFGLEPFWKDKPEPISLYKIQDGHPEEEFVVDPEGKYSFVQTLDTSHHIYIRPVKNTIYIYGSPGQVIYLKDLGYGSTIYHQIVVGSDGIIIDGIGTQHIGYSPGTGIYLKNRSGVTIRNCTIYNWGYAIHSLGSWYCTYTNNNIGPNTYFGIRFDNASWYNYISYNEIHDAAHGVFLSPNCSNNHVHNNISIRGHSYEGIYLGYTCYYNRLKFSHF